MRDYVESAMAHFERDALVEPDFPVRLAAHLLKAKDALALPWLGVLQLSARQGQLAPAWVASTLPTAPAAPSLTEFHQAIRRGQLALGDADALIRPLRVAPSLSQEGDSALVLARAAGAAISDPNLLAELAVSLEVGLSHHRRQQLANVVAAALMQAPDPIELTDSDATLLYVNAAWERFFGYSREEAIGRTVAALLRGKEPLHDEAFYQFTLATVVEGRAWLGALGSRSKQGETRHHEAHVGRFESESEGFLGNIAIRRDTSHRAVRDEALAVVHKEFRSVLAAIPDGVAVLRDGRIYFANPSFLSMVQLSVKEVVGRDYLEFIRQDDRARFETEHRKGLSRVRVRSGDAFRFAEISGAGSVSFEGRPATILISRDITDYRLVQEQLTRADKLAALGSLAAGVAHEINNPLAYISLNMKDARQLVAGRLAKQDPALDLIDEAIDGAHRIQRIVAELRGFSGSELPGPPEPVNVGNAISSALNIVQNELRHRARLERKQEPELYVAAREGQLVQVLVNVLVNAAQATPRSESAHVIRVKSRRRGTNVEIVVEDSGMGIPRDALSHVFDPFYTSKAPSEGSGLGLAISKRIIDGFGGQITLESEEGQGTTVSVLLPSVGAPTKSGNPRPAALRHKATSIRVLVVDDEPAICRALQRVLAEHEVELAATGKEALALIERDPRFDLIFCDLMMPGLSGPALFYEALQRHPELRDRFVFMTGGAFAEWGRRFIEEVNPPVMSKPFEPETVLMWVRLVAGDSRDNAGELRPR